MSMATDYNPHQMVNSCPYDPQHSVQAKNLWRHVMKCRDGWLKRCRETGVEPWTDDCKFCGYEYWALEASYHYKRCAYYGKPRVPAVVTLAKKPDVAEEKPKDVPVGILVEL